MIITRISEVKMLSRCVFVTCQNFLASMFVCPFVCPSVSLSILSAMTRERVDIWSPKLVHMCIESLIPVSNIDKEVGHVTRSPGQKLAKFSNCHNSVNFLARTSIKSSKCKSALGYPVKIASFRWHFWRKSSPRPQNFVTFQKNLLVQYSSN